MGRRKKTSLDTIVEREEKGTYQRLDAIIAKLMGHLESARETFAEYCKAAQEEGLNPKEAWQYLTKRLAGTVAKSTLHDWGTAYLPNGAKRRYTKTRYHNGKSPDSDFGESNGYSIEEHSDEGQDPEIGPDEDYGEPAEIWQIPAEEYKIEEVERYDRAFLIKLVKYLHEQLATQKPIQKRRGRPRK